VIRVITFILIFISLSSSAVYAQERVGPLYYHPPFKTYQQQSSAKSTKTTSVTLLTLPFFEDFTSRDIIIGYSDVPDAEKWEDKEVYINNTMAFEPVSRGVATFDGIDKNGIPYDNVKTLLADSLTSRPINLSANTPADSIYLSFFYQPQGTGFAPEPQDSLVLYFKRKSSPGWARVWGVTGDNLQPFKQVMIPVTDTIFLDSFFQFRFMNYATMNTNDDVWNIDYIRMAAGRNKNDTAINDVAFTLEPTNLLNDYTQMPYEQYTVNANAERATQISAWIRNNTASNQSLTTSIVSIEKAALLNSGSSSLSMTPYSEQAITYPAYTTQIPLPSAHNEWVIYEDKYFIQSPSATDHKENDTILHKQIFYNEFAYDDGTAEKSYYLNLFATLPGKTAIEFHLNKPDTIKGVAIYFGRQVPSGAGKFFSVAVYSDITSNNGTIILQQDFLNPGYLNVNNFYVYKFDEPKVIPAGTFYVGTIQPALSNSDSLYLGLDVNRIGGNHLYFNTLGFWEPSAVSGAVMIRPIFGPIIASGISEVNVNSRQVDWSVSPAPATDKLQFHFDSYKPASFEIYDMQGRKLREGNVKPEETIEIADLNAGMYLVHLSVDGIAGKPQKIIKL
jgi:hypothetical protein